MKNALQRSLVFTLIVCAYSAVHGFARCKGLSAEEVGTRFGTVLLEICQAFVEAEVWNNPDCKSPKSKQLSRLCSMVDEMEEAAEKVNKAADRGCFDDTGDYAQSADLYVFRTLKTALSSDDSKLHWQGLMRMYILCDDATMVTEAGQKGCGQEVEGAALSVLQTDRDPVNRHLALEILGSRFVTERSREILEQVAQTRRQLGERCPHGFRSDRSTYKNHTSWDEIAKNLIEGREACEQQLAREALSTLAHKGKSSLR